MHEVPTLSIPEMPISHESITAADPVFGDSRTMVTADLDRRCCLCHQGQPKGAALLLAVVRIAPSDWNERHSISFRSIYATYANSKCLLDSLSTRAH